MDDNDELIVIALLLALNKKKRKNCEDDEDVVTDSDYRFIAIDVGAFGRDSDSNIFNNWVYGKRLEENRLNLLEAKHLPGSNGPPLSKPNKQTVCLRQALSERRETEEIAQSDRQFQGCVFLSEVASIAVSGKPVSIKTFLIAHPIVSTFPLGIQSPSLNLHLRQAVDYVSSPESGKARASSNVSGAVATKPLN
ncbi:hypothetical protein EVAR_34119_1 [Eumeta japonica]|uniref:Uncharacterized protein n=1 Tax=Eumeta variegata TaxID=151549 RepID=A0A4C1WJY4_EUMVA|nr:hypothetical protein EVAR_34119_1 [Eumeta japonica]